MTEEWRAQAACRGMDTRLFFEARYSDRAKRVCATCCVREDCAAYAAATHQTCGLWGGMRTGTIQKRKLAVNRCKVCHELLMSARARYCEPCHKVVRAERMRQRRELAA